MKLLLINQKIIQVMQLFCVLGIFYLTVRNYHIAFSPSTPSSSSLLSPHEQERENFIKHLQESGELDLPLLAKRTSFHNISVCFITSQFGETLEAADRLVNLQSIFGTEYMNGTNKTKFHYFAFTNLNRLKTSGWTKIIPMNHAGNKTAPQTIPKYKRYITQSRWPKFQGFKHPTIRRSCDVVFYMDGLVDPYPETTAQDIAYQARRIIHSKVQFAQRLHYSSNTSNAIGEFQVILKRRKDIATNVAKSIQWLQEQPDYNDGKCTLYENAFFAYSVTSTSFQKAANFLWDHYSKEQDSWRDQPLWCYTLHHFKTTPLLLPDRLLRINARRTSKQKHRYGKEQENSAVKKSQTSTFNKAAAPLLRKGRRKLQRARTAASKKKDDTKSAFQTFEPLGAIFYNAFVPVNVTRNITDNALRIIDEQFSQVFLMEPNATIQYVLIGDKSADAIIKEKFCPYDHSCRRLEYLPVGSEQDTLQELWGYCQDHTESLVTYLHDKGSYTIETRNERARRVATVAAMHCRRLLHQEAEGVVIARPPMYKGRARTQYDEYANTTDDQVIHKNEKQELCTSCGFSFNILPQHHYRANMWSANCSYVRHLIQPRDYPHRIRSMYDELLASHSSIQKSDSADKGYENMLECLGPQQAEDNHLGLGRYSSERWINSHPSLRPCDAIDNIQHDFAIKLSTTNDRQPRHVNSRSLWTDLVQLHEAPQRGSFTKSINNTWGHIPGRLFEWNYLYNATPKQRSWVWEAYKIKKKQVQLIL